MALGVDAQNVALGEDLGSDREGSDLEDFRGVRQGASVGTDDRDPHVVADSPECSNSDSNYSLYSPDEVRNPKSQRYRKVKLMDRRLLRSKDVDDLDPEESKRGDAKKAKRKQREREMELLKSENRRLKKKMTCYGCEEAANIVFLSCGHLVSCDKCCEKAY